MIAKESRVGAGAMVLQGGLIVLYIVVLIHEHSNPQWIRGTTPLSSLDKTLLKSCIYLCLASAIIALLGLIVDKKRLCAGIALTAVFYLLILMAMSQGIG
jgi:hypothetical protein